MKIVGYILSIVGLAGLAASSFPTIREAILPPTLPIWLTNTTLTIGSVVLVVIGLFLIMKSGPGKAKQSAEVPIYAGSGKKRTIVGYQRLGK